MESGRNSDGALNRAVYEEEPEEQPDRRRMKDLLMLDKGIE